MSSLPPIGGIIHRIAFTVGAATLRAATVRTAQIVWLADGRFASQIRFDTRIAASDRFAGGNSLPLLPADDPHPALAWTRAAD